MSYKEVNLGLGANGLSGGDIADFLAAKIPIEPGEKVLLLTDDTFRPDTPLHRELLSYIVTSTLGGDTAVVVASGMHRQSTLQEIESKLGSLVKRVKLYRHSPLMRFPLRKFKDYTIVSVGTILPHIYVRRSGGGKIIAPGLASAEFASYFHNLGSDGARDFIKSGEKSIDYIVNGVVNSNSQTVNVLVNGMFLSHDENRTCKYNFGVKLEKPADLVILEPHIKTGDFMQAMNSLQLLKYDIVKPNGTVCLMCEPEDGMGVHYLFQAMNGLEPAKFDTAFKDLLKGRRFAVICKSILNESIQECFEKPIEFYNSLSHIILRMTQGDYYGSHAVQGTMKRDTVLDVVKYNGADVMISKEGK